MKHSLRIVRALIAVAVVVAAPALARGAETRCGWYDNPSPANATLTDRDGEWLISRQGGPEAKGDWSPAFDLDDESAFVRTGASYGHGCVCMKVRSDRKSRRILEVSSLRIKRLADCRRDRKLKEPAGVE